MPTLSHKIRLDPTESQIVEFKKACGCIKKTLELSERVFRCSDCGYTIDRDLNAAISIKHTVGHTGISAWGE